VAYFKEVGSITVWTTSKAFHGHHETVGGGGRVLSAQVRLGNLSVQYMAIDDRCSYYDSLSITSVDNDLIGDLALPTRNKTTISTFK